MKKMFITLIALFYIFSSFLFLTIYSFFELNNITYDKKGEVHNINLKSQLSQEKIIENIKNIADKYHFNITLLTTTINSDNRQKIKLFSYVKDENKFYKGIYVKSGLKINENLGLDPGSFISTEKTNTSFQVGTIGLIGTQNFVFEIRRFDDAKSENLSSDYILELQPGTDFKKVVQEFEKLGIEVKTVKYSNSQNFGFNFVLIVFCFLIFIVLTIIYNVVLRSKDIAIKKLNGYSDKKLILENFLFVFKPILIISVLSLIIFFVYTFFVYLHFNLEILNAYFMFVVISTVILTLFTLASCLFVYYVDINFGIKNKKPILQIQILNYLSKIAISLIIFSVSITSLIEINKFEQQKASFKVWENVKDYAYLTLSSSSRYMEASKYYNEYKQLFEELEIDRGLLLIDPSLYYSRDKKIAEKTDKIYKAPDYVDQTMYMNKRSFDLVGIVDVNGNKVILPEDDPNVLNVIVPEKYLNQKDAVEKYYIDSYKRRYYTENKENEANGLPLISSDKLKVNFIYVKNNQKYFSYNPEASIQTNNYIIDPVVEIVNSNNYDKSWYSTFASHSAMFFKVNNLDNPYEDILPILKKYDLDKDIKFTPLVYSKVSNVVSQYNRTIKFNSLLLFITFIIYIIILIYTVINYLEKTKLDNAVKYIHGYGFVKRYILFILLTIIPTIVISLGLGFIFEALNISIIALGIVLFVEILTIVIVLNIKELSNSRNILKGQ